MFLSNRIENDVGRAGVDRPADKPPLSLRSDTCPEPPLKRRSHHGVLPRIAAARGWRTTFMSV